jgi:hypothetical protein
MVMQGRSAQLEKKHREFLEFLRSRPEGFNFSRFVRKRLEEKMSETEWEYQEEEDQSKPEIVFKEDLEET